MSTAHASDTFFLLGPADPALGVAAENLPLVGAPGTHPDDLRQQVDAILAVHRPDRPLVNFSWRALPTVNAGRRCQDCSMAWPCTAVECARAHKAHDLSTWTL